MKNQVVIFEHLPKTAGISLQAVLRRHYRFLFKLNSFQPLASIEELAELDKEVRARFELIIGHGASHAAHLFKDPFLFTLLRHPLERFVSQYNYIQTTSEHRSHERVRDLTLDAYIEMAKSLDEDNLQVRFLSSAMRPTLEQKGYSLSEEHFAEAKARLQSFDAVYDTKHFDSALWSLKKRLNWSWFIYYRKKNVGSKRVSIQNLTSSQRMKIEKLEWLDLKLYTWAADQYSWADESIKRKLFSRCNALINLFLRPERVHRAR